MQDSENNSNKLSAEGEVSKLGISFEPADSDHDSPWKSAIELFFQPCMELLFADIAREIDWSVEPLFMDKELQKLTSDSDDKRRYVDKLVKVRGIKGDYRWLLLHIEVQGAPEKDFAKRMFTYYYRLAERFAEPIVSMAILTDNRKNFRPSSFRQEFLGCKIYFEFVMVKLLDLQPQMDELLESDNIFALLVAAQLVAKQVKQARQRTDAVLNFYRMARKKNHSRQHIIKMLDFVEWIIRIPKHELEYYNDEIDLIEKEDKSMSYMAIYRRESYAKGVMEGIEQGIEQGIERGMEQGVERGIRHGVGRGRSATIAKLLRLKFGEVAQQWLEQLDNATDEQLDLWTERILFADSIEAVFAE